MWLPWQVMCRQKHVSDEVKVEHVDVALSANEGVPCHCYRYKLYCVSCSACQKNQRWRGATAHTSNSKTLTMQKWRGGQRRRAWRHEIRSTEGLFEVGLQTGTRLRRWRRISRNASKSHGLKRQVSLCEELGYGLPVQLVQVGHSWFPSSALRRRLRVGDLRRMGAFRGLGRRMFLPFLSVRVWRFLGYWVSCILGGSDPFWQIYREDFFGGHTLVNLTSSCSDSIENSAKQRMTDIWHTAGMLGKLLLVVSSDFRGHGFPTSFLEGIVAVAVSESALA